MAEARRQRALLSAVACSRELVLTPTVTFAEVAARWLAEFEAKVAAGARRERTLENYRNQLERHLLPRLGRRRLQLITADELAELIAELQAQGLAPWTVRGIMVPLGCVFGFAVRRGHRDRFTLVREFAPFDFRRSNPYTTSGRLRSRPRSGGFPT